MNQFAARFLGIRRVAFSIAALVIAVVGITGQSAAPAQAASSYCNASSCALWGSAGTSQYIFDMPRGTAVTMICWTDSQWWNGTNRWFKVRTYYGSGIHWMNANQVSGQTWTPHC